MVGVAGINKFTVGTGDAATTDEAAATGTWDVVGVVGTCNGVFNCATWLSCKFRGVEEEQRSEHAS